MELFKDLKELGYNYIIIPKGARTRCLATKAKMNKNNNFKNFDLFEEFRAVSDFEKEAMKILPKGVFINLWS